MKSSFIEGWKPSDDGRIHTTFTFRPASGQLSSRKPNVQQGPVHAKLAAKFKETIEARAGYLLVNLDYKSYHALMLGFLAECPEYMRLAMLDIHSYVTAYMVQYPNYNECINWEDAVLLKYLKEVKAKYKSIRDDQAKHAILGIGFGLGETGCYERYKADFNPTIEEALQGKRKAYEGEALAKLIETIGKQRVKDLYNLLKKLFPAVFKWQERTIMQADSQGYIQTFYGARRWFHGASKIEYNMFGKIIRVSKGEQAEQALAFPVSNNAHYHMRETMVILDQLGLLEEAGLINMIHDSLVFEMPENRVEELCKAIIPVMERKSTLIFNAKGEPFSCGADGKFGKNMNEMEELKF
jgi:DNA polymerase I-like protein with 3'-5' exonuclease and polymerase domains